MPFALKDERLWEAAARQSSLARRRLVSGRVKRGPMISSNGWRYAAPRCLTPRPNPAVPEETASPTYADDRMFYKVEK
jgi:hypothetical protein